MSLIETIYVSEKEIVQYNNSASQVQRNVYSSYKTNIVPEQTSQTQFKWDQLQSKKELLYYILLNKEK